MSKLLKNKKNNLAGFTLIEVMVAMSIFIIVMVIAMGAVLSTVDANRKTQSLGSVVNNLDLAIDSMVRDIRTGSNYVLVSNGTVKGINFTDSDGNAAEYSWDSATGKISKDFNPSSAGIHGEVTSSQVRVTSFDLNLIGTTPGDGLQPMLLLQIKASSGVDKTKSNFVIQTLITQRIKDNT